MLTNPKFNLLINANRTKAVNKLFPLILMLTSFTVESVNDGEIFPCGEERTSDITFVKRMLPLYPNHIPIDYFNGWVELKLNVDSNGKAVEVTILKSKPERLFDRSAKKSLLRSEFSKSEVHEFRCGIITVEFSLKD